MFFVLYILHLFLNDAFTISSRFIHWDKGSILLQKDGCICMCWILNGRGWMPDFQTLSLSHSLSLQVPLKQWVSSTTTWIVTDPLADCFLLLANRTVSDAIAVHGKDPQHLVEKIIRERIYDSLYWKEHCFGLSCKYITL